MDLPVGMRRISESAFEFYWQGEASIKLSKSIIAFCCALKKELQKRDQIHVMFKNGSMELIPGLNSFAIYFQNTSDYLISKTIDDIQTWCWNYQIKEQIDGMTQIAEFKQAQSNRFVLLPCLYDGQDLKSVASSLELSEAEVKQSHQNSEFLLALKGFQRHFPYLIGLSSQLQLPRKHFPLQRVPKGSVAIAEKMCGIYPETSPGGWHLIGTTQLEFLPFLKLGDSIRFFEVKSLPNGLKEEEFIERFVQEG